MEPTAIVPVVAGVLAVIVSVVSIQRRRARVSK
jgi:hypothetical protein